MADEAEVIRVSVFSPDRVLFDGKARSASFPGEKGYFEVFPQHKPLLSRLLRGVVTIDRKALTITRGIIRVGLNSVVAIVETPAHAIKRDV
jgi:F-type H+-transporting ATPase subunit epsilon